MEAKIAATSSDPAGGYLAPPDFVREVIRLGKEQAWCASSRAFSLLEPGSSRFLCTLDIPAPQRLAS
jgi:predicted phage gp36 major capsid-like protein